MTYQVPTEKIIIDSLILYNMAANVSHHKVRVTKTEVNSLLADIRQYMDRNGYLSWSNKEQKYVLVGTNLPRRGLVACPQCKVGQLLIIRSHQTGKRFMGCSNYPNGCMASSPLLQKARLRGTKQPCDECGWPIIIFRYTRNQKWTRQCANIHCPTRSTNAS